MDKKFSKRKLKLPVLKSDLELDYERYLPQMTGLIHYEHLHRYMFAAEFSVGKTVLDIACGEGYGCNLLSQIAKSVIGIDISKEAITVAREKYTQENINFIESDAINTPIENNSVDVVVSFETIEHLEDHDAFILEIKRVLKNDGVAILSSPNKYVFSTINGMDNEFHVSEITYGEFGDLMKHWFKNTQILNQQVFGASHLSGVSNSNKPVYFEKNEYGEILKNYDIDNPLYSIAVVSDSELPSVFNSFYIDTINKYNGMHCYEWETSVYSNIINDFKQNSSNYEAMLDQKVSEIADMHQELSQKDSELSLLHQDHKSLLVKKDSKIADMHQELLQKDSELSLLHQDHKSLLVKKDSEIADMHQELSQKDSELSLLHQDHKSLLVKKDSEIAQLQQDSASLLAHKDEELTNLRLKGEIYLRHAVAKPFLSILKNEIAKRIKFTRDKSALKSSPLFNADYYVAENPDIKEAGVDPIKHYLVYGWMELRDPSQDFSTRQYLRLFPDIVEVGINPLVHYIRHGQSEGRLAPRVALGASQENQLKQYLENDIAAFDQTFNLLECPFSAVKEDEVETIRNSSFFNEAYYRNSNKDIAASDMDMSRHYCEHGWREGRNPSALFDTNYYLEMNHDIRNSGINPLYHYIASGRDEGRQASQIHNCDYEDDCNFGSINTDIKPIAFYLPQFHEIPENNEWWGEGFTEWTNTRKAKPKLDGHYQPRVPHSNIGYYDLSDWQVLKQQAEMAKKHGIYGFCFYHYWFAGKRLLEKPVDMLLEHPEIDFPFCLCWANENWTRRWDGHEEDILMEQQHSDADDIAFINDLKRYIVDERYIRIEGKPVILLYRPGLLPNAKETVNRWRKQIKKSGVGEVYLVCAYGSFGDNSLPSAYGFDAGFEFPPNVLESHQQHFQTHTESNSNIYKYGQFVADVLNKRESEKNKDTNLFYSVMLEWDNSPRRENGATIFTSYSSLIYRKWLDKTIEITRQKHKEDRRFLFINAWNEWAEGTYLEPDKRYGYISLNETSRALCNIAPGRKLPKVSVIVPNYNHAQFLRRRLDSIYQQTYRNIEVILMDDCSTDNSRKILDEYAERYADITRREYNDTNSGGVFHQWAKGIRQATGELVWVAESDDFCDENFLDTLVKSFEDEAVLLAYSHCVFVDKNETPLAEGGFEYYVGEIDPKKWQSSYVETAHNEVRSALGFINSIPNASGTVFRRPHDLPLLEDKEWLSMSVAGDWVFYLHIIHGGKVAYEAQTSNYFRRYEGSAAESTYRREVFFREVGKASLTAASLYDVPMQVLEKSRKYFLDFFKNNVGDNDEKFHEWYDFDAILDARKKRLPAVMISLFAFYPGGAEIISIRLANEFKRQGVAVLVHSGKVIPRENRIRRMLRNDVPVLETDNLDEFKDAVKAFGIDVLNSHHWHIQGYPLTEPAVFAELPQHVATLHGMIEDEGGYGVTSEQLRLVDKTVSTWVYTADKNVKLLQTAGLYDDNSDKFIKIPNGMEPPNEQPVPRGEMNIPEDAFVLCTVSRAIPEKGWAETIEVIAKARELSGKDIRLILIGNGPIYDDYCRDGIPDFVYMPGFDSRSVGFYAAADMGIMLTRFRSESFPLTITDCLAAGKPYIASDIGEIRNMLTTDDGMAGAVFDLNDWSIPVDAVARIVADFALDVNRYSQVKSRVPQAAERYYIDIVAKKYLDVFSLPQNDADCLDNTATNKGTPAGVSFYETEFFQKFIDDGETFLKEVVGFCPICDGKATFRSDHKWLRDNYRCNKCNSIPRWRYLQYTIQSLVPDWQDMSIHESSPCTDFIKRKAPGYSASQYYPDMVPGERVGEYTNENLEALTFADSMLDLFLSQDVLEHVFHPEKAVKEMLRVVKLGGYVIFTIPVFHGKNTVKRAQLDDCENVEFLEEAVYHGNPVDSQGSLAVWDYGDDFVEDLKRWAGSNEVQVYNHPIPEMGIEGEFLDVFCINKNQPGYGDKNTSKNNFDCPSQSDTPPSNLLKHRKSKVSPSPYQQAKELRTSKLFDDDFYLSQFSDATSIKNPLLHYVEQGCEAGLMPNTWFDIKYIKEKQPAYGCEAANPLWYFYKYFRENSEYQTHSKMHRKAHCSICGCERLFLAYIDTVDSYNHLRCIVCNGAPRDRAVTKLLDEHFPWWKSGSFHESSPSNKCFEQNAGDYSASNYFHDKPLGTLVGHLRNESLESLTFEDNTFDFIVAVDVVEHVFHPDRMVQEMLRVTKHGGGAIFTTVPDYSIEKSAPRAIIDEETLEITQLAPPIYHGNPIAADSLMTWDFGRDFNNKIEEWSGVELVHWSEVDEKHGIIQGGVPHVYLLKKK